MIYQSRSLFWVLVFALLWASPLHGVERSCLIIATSILNPGSVGPEMKDDELVQGIIAAAHEQQQQLGSDPTSLLAEAARSDIRKRADALSTMIQNRPDDVELRTYNTGIIGGGPTGAVLASNLDGTRTCVFNSDEYMGTFSRFGDMFYINSTETPGKPSPNMLPAETPNVQVGLMADRSTPPGRLIGNATEINLAMSHADFRLHSIVTRARWIPEKKQFEVITSSGEKHYMDVVVAGTGLGARKFPFKDEATLQLIGKEYASGNPHIRFIDDFMTEENTKARSGINPLHRYARKRVVVIGKGDGGSISSELLLGLAPDAAYAYRRGEIVPGILPSSVTWLGPEWTNSTEYKKATWERYWDLAPFIDNRKLIPKAGHASRIEKQSDGTFKVFFGTGPADFLVADEIVVSAGYDNTVAPAIFAELAPGNDSSKLVTQMVKSPDGRYNIARQVVWNGVPIPAFIAGPATGGLETVDEPGGDKSPRIQVMGWRNQALARYIRSLIPRPRRCINCDVQTPITVTTTAPSHFVTMELKPGLTSIRAATENERELRIRYRMISMIDQLYPTGFSRKISFRIAPENGTWIVGSADLDSASLTRIKTLIESDIDLVTLIRTQPALKNRRAITVNYEPANPKSLITSVEFTPAR